MSRIGNKAILIPGKVAVEIGLEYLSITGTHGSLRIPIPLKVSVNCNLTQSLLFVTRCDDSNIAKSLHGLTRSLISNCIAGVDRPWEVKLEIIGVGYQASLSNAVLTLDVGYSNPLKIQIPVGVTCVLPDSTHIILTSADKQLVGQIAANIREMRKPEPYKGKGIRYAGENVRRKSGKAFGS